MRGAATLCNVLYWLALTLWVGVLIAAGVAAVSAFSVLPDPHLGVSLEQFSQYEASQGVHGRIAAGHVMEPIFTFTDIAQVVAGSVTFLALLMQLIVFRSQWTWRGRFWHGLRTLCIVLALGLFGYRVFTLTPEMNRDLRAYWSAAEAGDATAADHHYVAFTRNHPRASRLYNGTLVLLLVAVAASAAAPLLHAVGKRTALETPRLARKL